MDAGGSLAELTVRNGATDIGPVKGQQDEALGFSYDLPTTCEGEALLNIPTIVRNRARLTVALRHLASLYGTAMHFHLWRPWVNKTRPAQTEPAPLGWALW